MRPCPPLVVTVVACRRQPGKVHTLGLPDGVASVRNEFLPEPLLMSGDSASLRCARPRLSAVDYPSTNEFWHWDEIRRHDFANVRDFTLKSCSMTSASLSDFMLCMNSSCFTGIHDPPPS